MDKKRITDTLAGFALSVNYADLPAEVIKAGKQSLLDSLGVMGAAASLEPDCEPFIEYALENSRQDQAGATIIGTGKRASPVMAAFANGALIHALDYEDGHDRSKAHPNTAVIPVLLALSQSGRSVSGRDFLLAMAVGSETVCRLKLALMVDDLQNGWYSPAMFSAYGAVFAGARLLGMDAGRLQDALSLCMTQIMMPGQAARSRNSSLRAVREAFSAKAAIVSLLLAGKGVMARMDEPFEGPLGLYHMMGKGSYDPAVIVDGLGKTWISSELRYKYWPCCGTTHGGVHALLSVLKEHPLSPEEVLDIHLTIDPVHLRVLEPYETKYRPGTLGAAKFSMPFCLALALYYGNVRLDMFTEENLHNEKLLRLARKVTWELRPGGADGLGDDHIRLRLCTTRAVFEKEIFKTPGSPDMPLSALQLEEKFLDCSRFFPHGISAEQAGSVQKTLERAEAIPDMGEFIGSAFS